MKLSDPAVAQSARHIKDAQSNPERKVGPGPARTLIISAWRPVVKWPTSTPRDKVAAYGR
ncbi:hypothetical protein [Kitasatospora sp. DSM 101779]|uniref:hypothetical protein n=1 Tax=Kitasatospora sp. DSM 101779 TaxID=2853165 RepID=UPI0021D86D9F|nr:hypothetical protein [Kitasatospora sp. DSM 101779]MCU7825496.1 hypothetical protein [Kitasatospora sp. DSM 101779]